MEHTRKRSSIRIGLDIDRDRNRELLTRLFSDCDVFEFSGAVPDRTDICIIDSPALARSAKRFGTWHTQQSPVFAPVVLLVEGDASNALAESKRRDYVDSVCRIPMPKAELSSRIDNLLQMREFSRELDAERTLTELIFDASPLAKLVLESDGTVIRANKRAGKVFEMDRVDLIGQRYNSGEWSAVSTDGTEIPRDERPFMQVIRTNQAVYGYEHILARPGYDDMWVSVNMAPIRDESDRIAYVVVVIEDITIRTTQAQELERQVDLFKKAEDIANVGAWEYDARTDAYWGTKEVKRIHGLAEDADLTPTQRLQFYHPEDRPVIQAAFEAALTEGEPYDLELRLIRKDGEQRWVHTRGEPQCENGTVVRIRGTLQDITDRKEREKDLEQMTNAVDRAPIGITLSDPTQEDNPLTYVNDRFTELTGYTREEAIGRNCRFLQGAETDETTVARIRQAIDAKEQISVTIRNYRADGSVFWNRLEIAPVRNNDGTVVNYIGFQQDVTSLVQRQRQLQMLDRYLRHNLRNSMNVVLGQAELLQEHDDAAVTASAETIERVSSRLMNSMELEREVTEILREEQDTVAIELLPVLQSTVTELSRRYPAATISVSCQDNASVRAVPYLSTALGELIENAIKHNDAPSPYVDITVETDGDVVRIRIADNGPGIPEMEVDVLSNAKAETAVYHGQGLGLWLVYLFVQESGGRLEIEDSSRGGAVVTVELSLGTTVQSDSPHN